MTKRIKHCRQFQSGEFFAEFELIELLCRTFETLQCYVENGVIHIRQALHASFQSNMCFSGVYFQEVANRIANLSLYSGMHIKTHVEPLQRRNPIGNVFHRHLAAACRGKKAMCRIDKVRIRSPTLCLYADLHFQVGIFSFHVHIAACYSPRTYDKFTAEVFHPLPATFRGGKPAEGCRYGVGNNLHIAD